MSRGSLKRVASAQWWRDLVLTAGAVLGAVCIVLTIAAALFDVRPLVFRSGSMSPTIDTGDLGISRTVDAKEIREGDIVSVIDSRGHRVTHRVVALDRHGGQATLTLKGDDNEIPDAEPYVVPSAERVVFSVPRAGHVVSWLSGPAGIFLLGGYVTFLALVLFGRHPESPDERGESGRGDQRGRAGERRRARARRTARGAAGLVTLAVAVAGATHRGAVPTLAAWNDTARATGGTFAAHAVASQVAPTCSNEGGVLGLLGYSRLTWPHVDTRYEYAYTITNVTTGVEVASGKVTPTGAVGSSVTLDVTAALLSLTVGSVNFDVSIRARLKASPAWTAATATVTRVHSQNLLVGLSVRCGTA